MVISVGRHLLTRGTLLGVQIDEMLDGAPPVHILYSDPPWNDRILKFFENRARRSGVEHVDPTSYADICRAMARLIDLYVVGYAFIETAVTGVDQMLAAVKPMVNETRVFSTRYGSREARIIAGAFFGEPLHDIPEGLGGLPLVRACLAPVARAGEYVLDPCCGSGLTAKAAVPLGMGFIGNELDPNRLDLCRRWLEAHK